MGHHKIEILRGQRNLAILCELFLFCFCPSIIVLANDNLFISVQAKLGSILTPPLLSIYPPVFYWFPHREHVGKHSIALSTRLTPREGKRRECTLALGAPTSCPAWRPRGLFVLWAPRLFSEENTVSSLQSRWD